MNDQPAVLAEVTRGAIVESRHWGAVAVVTPDNRLVASAGNIDFVTYLRSSAKPHQAIGVILSGAAEKFNFTHRELAVMAGSHSGEPYHTETVAGILDKLGLPMSALRCGIHPPFSRSATEALGTASPNELHNNCSGKHAGMLASAITCGNSLDDYYQVDHPVQQTIAAIVAKFAGIAPEQLIVSVDGCSAATFAMSVRNMALIYARLVNPVELNTVLAAAATEVTKAMLEFPEMVAADTHRLDTNLMRALPGRLVAKAGAEGVYTMALLPCAEYPAGIGIAIKIEDGDLARGRNAATIGVLQQLNLLTDEQYQKLAAEYLFQIKNHRGLVVGEVRPAFKLNFHTE